MVRVFLEIVLPVLVPFLAYHLWLRLRGLRATLRGLGLTLAVALGLAAASLLSLSQFGGAPPGTVYVPAHLDAGGNLVPGQFVPEAAP
jgi:hypothetical protein